MGLTEMWSRALVYFGVAEEEEYWDESSFSAEDQLERSYAERPNVRRLSPQRAQRRWDPNWAEPDVSSSAGVAQDVYEPRIERHERREQPQRSTQPSASARAQTRRQLAAVPSAAGRVHLVIPKSFNDAQAVADRFKAEMPVIINLQSIDAELSKRLIDFASGLTYALEGSMQRIADKVFLLTPKHVEVSAEERTKLVDDGFFNQA